MVPFVCNAAALFKIHIKYRLSNTVVVVWAKSFTLKAALK